jgi:hypothetical protein
MEGSAMPAATNGHDIVHLPAAVFVVFHLPAATKA